MSSAYRGDRESDFINGLASKASSGDKATLKQLFELDIFLDRLKKICKRIAKRRQLFGYTIEPRELEQEAIKKIMDNINKYDGKGPFEGWVSTLIKNLLIDMHRHQILQDEYVREQGGTFSNEGFRGNYVEERVVKNINRSELISKLTPRERSALRLRVEGHTLKVIAKRLGISIAQASRIMKTVLQKLQDMVLSAGE